MPVADTSFLVDIIRHDPNALAKLEALESEGKPLSITPVIALELFEGAYRSLRVEENVKEKLAILSLCDEVPFDTDIYHAFGYLSATLQECGSPVGDFDQAIAAAALCYDAEIITRDQHFEKIPELKVIVY
ncbi:type II toxin-antitoxin system VapC family toxin [Methanoregula sp.]|uniref:type II toxin-antitoxin system VapC family toxin n=1 Tax=Methanoregula sp. TaxID=2052170 RepID=UPI000CBB4441|nr:type II toxin-antitoxin system VapC family toxin [Methanoregula sp.]PKG31362.1 MAG: VapC toxin family PIN domain ribonuclease [Methanoregula sp.]